MQAPILDFPKIPFNLEILSKYPVLMAILGIFGVFYFITTVVLFYHWISYGMGNRGIYIAEILFVSVSVLFFVFAFLSASYF